MADLYVDVMRGDTPRQQMMAPQLTPTLWVDAATGDDSRSKATVAASGGSLPWATIGRAAWGSTSRSSPNASEAAAAGDVVAVAAGTYDYSGSLSAEPDNRFAVLYNPANEGTSGSPITFVASGTVTLTAAALDAPIIGANGRDYITWRGFTINNIDVLHTPDTGPVVFTGCTGGVVRNCTITGYTVNYIDNYPGVRIENADHITVAYNTISNYRRVSDNHNGCAVQLYGAADCTIERNYLYNCGGGVFFKDTSMTNTQQGNVVRFNHIDTCNEAVVFSEVTPGSTEGRHDIYQNLITNCGMGFSLIGAVDSVIAHNTVILTATGVGVFINGLSNKTGVRIWNNIFSGGARSIEVNGVGMEPATDVSFEHNCYFGATNFFRNDGGNQSFAAFNATHTDQHAASPTAINSDPLFVGGSDYRLQAGSPARNLGVDLLDRDSDGSTTDAVHAGCYLTGSEVVGVGG